MLTFEDVMEIANQISYKDWTLKVFRINDALSGLQWIFHDEEGIQACRIWNIDHSQPKSDIVRTALFGVLTAEEHEARERFRYKGKKVFNPHYDVDKLADIAGYLEYLDVPETNDA